jgi:WD40 repeat protein
MVREYKEHVDFISDMIPGKPQNGSLMSPTSFLASSGDGCLSAFDLRQKKPLGVSDNQEDELLSLAIVKGGKKVLAGTQSGTLLLFNYGQWGDHTDRLCGLESPVETLLSVDASGGQVWAGDQDGQIFECTVLPNEITRRVGVHSSSLSKPGKTGEVPIEKLCWSHDGKWILCGGHDGVVQFWDHQSPRFSLTSLETKGPQPKRPSGERNHEESSDSDDESQKRPAPKKKHKKQIQTFLNKQAQSEFFDDLD